MKFLIAIFFSIKVYAQDSVTLTVHWSKKVKDKVYYIFKLETGEKVKSVCECQVRRKKGETIRVSRKDLVFIKQQDY